MTTFKLVSFPSKNAPNIEIIGKIERSENHLSIHYNIQGDIDQIVIPASSPNPTRKDDLWKATCFEFFLAIPDQPQYWEFNMSPSGDWNIYKMDAYRRIGFREETTINQFPFEFRKNGDFSLDLSMSLSPIIPIEQDAQVSITAIIQTSDGNETYWALAHSGKEADFHLRDSFIIQV